MSASSVLNEMIARRLCGLLQEAKTETQIICFHPKQNKTKTSKPISRLRLSLEPKQLYISVPCPEQQFHTFPLQFQLCSSCLMSILMTTDCQAIAKIKGKFNMSSEVRETCYVPQAAIHKFLVSLNMKTAIIIARLS